jgi:SNF2 family DNA or RNA helicase
MLFVPHDYQKSIVDKIVNDKSAFIIATMGAGKSAATLEGVRQLIDGFDAYRVLVVAPLRVAKHTWPTEVKKWDNFKDLTTATAIGTPTQRVKAISSGADLTFINRENIPWLVETYGNKFPFDTVVIDESSSFKNSSSKRFKSLKKVRKLADRWVLLTGTPSPNSLLELWSQVYLLDGGDRLGRSFTAFKSRFFESDYMGYKYDLRPGSEQLIDDRS